MGKCERVEICLLRLRHESVCIRGVFEDLIQKVDFSGDGQRYVNLMNPIAQGACCSTIFAIGVETQEFACVRLGRSTISCWKADDDFAIPKGEDMLSTEKFGQHGE